MLQDSRLRQAGHTFTEYGIILALVAVVCVSALILFGGSVQGTLGNVSSKVGGGGGGTMSLLAPVSRPGNPAGTSLATYNPETGTITFPTSVSPSTNSSSTATNATSVEGSVTAVSAQLRELAMNWKSSDGKPLDESIRNKILDLANRGQDIASMQEAAVKNPNDSEGNLQGLTDKAGFYIQSHKALMADLGPLQNDPDFQALNKQIDTYSGIITAVNAKNFIADNGQVNTAQYIIGNPPAGIVDGTAKVDSPVVTQETAVKIEETAGP